MRDVTKSFISCTWALSLLGVKQAVNVLSGLGGEAPMRNVGPAFDSVAQTASQHLGNSLGRVFESGENIQKSALDMLMSLALPLRTPMGAPPTAGIQAGAPEAQQQPGAPPGAWGPMPPS